MWYRQRNRPCWETSDFASTVGGGTQAGSSASAVVIHEPSRKARETPRVRRSANRVECFMGTTADAIWIGHITTKDTKGSQHETLDAIFVLMRLERFGGGCRQSRSETSAHLDSTFDIAVRDFVLFLRALRVLRGSFRLLRYVEGHARRRAASRCYFGRISSPLTPRSSRNRPPRFSSSPIAPVTNNWSIFGPPKATLLVVTLPPS
jgi:hypothetical protein